MLSALTLLGGLALIVAESVGLRLFGIRVLAPELAVLAVSYVALRRSFATGALATLIFAAVADLCWGGPRGYYALGLTVTFFTMSAVRLRWRPQRALFVALSVVPAVWLTDAVAISSLALFRRGRAPLDALIEISPLTALLTGLVALPLAWFQLRIDRLMERRHQGGVAF